MEGISIKALNAKISALAKRTAAWRNEVQLCLVGCAQHAFDHSNVDPCTKIVHALTGADAKALIFWIEEHMPAVWVKADNAFRFNKSFKGEYDAITLMAEAWWERATQPKDISSSLDVLEALRTFIKRMEKEAAKEIDGKKMNVDHAELLDAVKALANSTEYATKQ